MRRCLIAVMALVLGGCRPKDARGQEPSSSSDNPAVSDYLPSETAVSAPGGPLRASAAAGRVGPELKAALAAKDLKLGDPVFVRIFKEERVLEVWMRRRATKKYELFRSWPVAAMSGVLGPKLTEGDGQAPEGFYFVTPDRMKPDSQFHLAFNVGYPNEYDQAHGRNGTFLMVHGNALSIGCFAMTDPKIEEIYTLCDAALKHGQPFFRVHSFPFRMTPERMAAAVGNPWEEFWKNLKEGYDRFETDKVPPDVTVEGKRYVVGGREG